jgi:farnesyl diphosphate synthase
MSFAADLARDAGLIGQYLADQLRDRGDAPVVQAMRYGVAGGKRLRGFLVMESARLHGLAPAAALPAQLFADSRRSARDG